MAAMCTIFVHTLCLFSICQSQLISTTASTTNLTTDAPMNITQIINNTILTTASPTSTPLQLPTTTIFINKTVYQTIICTDCKDKHINCNPLPTTISRSDSQCIIICPSIYSCNNTIFNCQDDVTCNIICNATSSCNGATVNCGIDIDCYINGDSDLSLTNSIINGPSSNGQLIINCNGNNTCFNSNIRGNTSNELRINCNGSNSCNNIVIYCPSYTNNTNYTINEKHIIKHCIINGDGDILDIHNNITIYAANSWKDIQFVEYFPILQGRESKMHCDDGQCIINDPDINKEWNCDDIMASCYVEKANIAIIHCNRNNCTESINCNNYPGDGCRIICYGGSSCLSLDILCSDNKRKCDVVCIGDNSCSKANIFGGINNEMNIVCIGSDSCQQTNFYGNMSNELIIECLSVNGSCNDMNVYCPSNIDKIKQCMIRNNGLGEDTDIHSNLDFYCFNGFDDLDITNYSAKFVENDDMMVNTTNMMHCGTNYNLSCSLNISLMCDCIGQDFVTPLSYTEMIGLIVGCAVIVIIVIFTLIYYFGCTPKKEEETQYSPVQNEQITQNKKEMIELTETT